MHTQRYVLKACRSKSQLSFISYVSGYDLDLNATGNQYFLGSITEDAQISSEGQFVSH